MQRAVWTALAGVMIASPIATAAWVAPTAGDSPLNLNAVRSSADAGITAVDSVPHVAWRENDGVNYELRVARLTPAGWERVGEVAQPASPINHDSLGDAASAAIAAVAGTPYVAWAESDGTNTEVRVARPRADGLGWERVGQGLNPASPLNQAPDRDATAVRIADIGGTPYVAWAEDDGVSTKMRVARPRPDGAGWDRVGQILDNANPLNRRPTADAYEPSIASVAGAPHIAWAEDDGDNSQIRVARLRADGAGWERLGEARAPASPINADANRDARNPALVDWDGRPVVVWVESAGRGNRLIHAAQLSTAGSGWESLDRGLGINNDRRRPATAPHATVVAGQLWVTWSEYDGRNREIRVARLASPAGAWQQMATGISPINADPGRDADNPAVTAVDNVPYVAWVETDGTNRETRVARLEPDFTQLSADVRDERADLAARVDTFGLPFAVGFQLSGAGVAKETRPGPPGGTPPTTVARIDGLRSRATYQWRPFVPVGRDLRAYGPVQVISTTAVTRLRLRVDGLVRGRVLRAVAGRPTGIRVRLNLRSAVTVTVSGRGTTPRSVTRILLPGAHGLRIDLPRRPGTYRVQVRARASLQRVATVVGTARVVPARRTS